MRRSKQIDIRQRRLHAACLWAVIAPADKGLDPDDTSAPPAQAALFLPQLFGRASIVAAGNDRPRGTRINPAARIPSVEGGEAFAVFGPPADALRHQRQ